MNKERKFQKFMQSFKNPTLSETVGIKDWNDDNLPLSVRNYYDNNLKGKKSLNQSQYEYHVKELTKLLSGNKTQKEIETDAYGKILQKTPIYQYAKPEQQKAMIDSLNTYLVSKKDFKSYKPSALKPMEGKKPNQENKPLTKRDKTSLENANNGFKFSLDNDDKEGVEHYKNEILKIRPDVKDSLNKVIELHDQNPKEAKSVYNKIYNFLWGSEEQTLPDNLEKDPTVGTPQIKEVEKIKTDDIPLKSPDLSSSKPTSYYDSSNKLNQYGVEKIGDVHKNRKDAFGDVQTMGSISYEEVESDPELKKILEGYVPSPQQEETYKEAEQRVNSPIKSYNWLLETGLLNVRSNNFEGWNEKDINEFFFSILENPAIQPNRIQEEGGNYVVYDPADPKLNKNWKLGDEIKFTKQTFKTKRSAKKHLNKIYKDWLKTYKKPTEKELEKFLKGRMYADAYDYFTRELNEEATWKNLEESTSKYGD